MPQKCKKAAKHSLDSLPPEIVSQIAQYASSGRFLRNLSLTCHALHEIVEADGWSAFVLNRFPSIQTPPLWREAAHGLTTLSRCFDRKAFIVQDAGPDFGPKHTRIYSSDGKVHARWQRPRGQTMGYQPIIDSHEKWIEQSWDSRLETVAWAAGAEIVVKIEERGPQVKKEYARIRAQQEDPGPALFDQMGNTKQIWLTHRDPQHREGLDDVTAFSLLKTEDPDDTRVRVIVGLASGGLQQIGLSRGGSTIERTFDRGGSTIRSIDISKGTRPLLVACLGDSQIALYSLDQSEKDMAPLSLTSSTSTHHGVRNWSSVFVGKENIAVGRGISRNIVNVFAVTQSALSKEPIRSFSSEIRQQIVPRTSAYPIVSVPQSSHASDCDGDLFFSGGYDGVIRLHDMRSPRDSVGNIADPIDISPIFSLAMLGREKIIAGASSHGLLKVYDLRMAGGKMYDSHETTEEKVVHVSSADLDTSGANISECGWNIFTPRTGPSVRSRNGRTTWSANSPIYSLSRPSPSSTALYVGLENQVLHFNFTSVLDAHPDPTFQSSVIRSKSGRINAVQTWDPHHNVIDVSMYNQSGPERTKLKYQRSVRETASMSAAQLREQANSSLDWRWHSIEHARGEAILDRRPYRA